MNNGLAPYCKLPLTNPACAYVPSHSTDIRETFKQFSVSDLQDDYELTDSLDFLSNGSFK